MVANSIKPRVVKQIINSETKEVIDIPVQKEEQGNIKRNVRKGFKYDGISCIRRNTEKMQKLQDIE